MLAEFHQIGDGRRILARLVTGDLHLMVANGRRLFPLALVVVNPNIDHPLYHAISPLLLTAYSICVIISLFDSIYVIK